MGNKVFLFLLIMLFFNTPLGAEEHAMFTDVLSRHVAEGMVDYPALCRDARFKKYIDQLAKTDPAKLTNDNQRMAFWINVYNAYTLKIICDNYPLKSISELHTGGLALGVLFKSTVWHKNLVTVNGEKTSLDHVEHNILRPDFQDPRIHFAIVCAAKGCPPLRSEAYEGEALDRQLNEQARLFLSQKDKNNFDPQNKIARISPIFSWFKNDFGRSRNDLVLFLADYLPEDMAAAIRADPARWKIRSTRYDWSLNEQ